MSRRGISCHVCGGCRFKFLKGTLRLLKNPTQPVDPCSSEAPSLFCFFCFFSKSHCDISSATPEKLDYKAEQQHPALGNHDPVTRGKLRTLLRAAFMSPKPTRLTAAAEGDALNIYPTSNSCMDLSLGLIPDGWLISENCK